MTDSGNITVDGASAVSQGEIDYKKFRLREHKLISDFYRMSKMIGAGK